MAQQVIIT